MKTCKDCHYVDYTVEENTAGVPRSVVCLCIIKKKNTVVDDPDTYTCKYFLDVQVAASGIKGMYQLIQDLKGLRIMDHVVSDKLVSDLWPIVVDLIRGVRDEEE